MGTLYLHSIPLAFVSLIPAYIVGEAWLGICLTVAIELVAPEVSPASISLFLFISNNISSVMPLLLPLLKDYYGLQRAMLILFPGLYVVSATLFSVSLLLLIARDQCHQADDVKSKSPSHARQTSRDRQRRRRRRRKRVQGKLSEASPLLREEKDLDSDSTESYGSDCGDFEEIDEREEENEAQRGVVSCSPGNRPRPIVVAASVNDTEDVGDRGLLTPEGRECHTVDPRGGASVSVMSQPIRVGASGKGREVAGRGRRGRGSYGAVEAPPRTAKSYSDRGPAPVVGSVSEWSMLSPSEEEKRWLAETQEGI